MSEEKLWNNARRWYRQAENDVDAAEVLLSAEKYAQASFLAQQAEQPGYGRPPREDEVSHTESIRYTSSLEIWDLFAQGAL